MPEQKQIKGVSADSEIPVDPPAPDPVAKQEERKLAKEERRVGINKLKLENERLVEQIQGLRNDNTARVDYANRIFCLIAVWLGVILLIFLLQGALGKEGIPFDWTFGMYGPRGTGVWHFDLPPEVLLALIGGTTASVIGIFTFVASYLFPKPSSKPE